MILVIDAINKDKHGAVLEDMFRLRARVFADRLGWDVQIRDGMEMDAFDALDPAYLVGLDEEDRVVSCVRLLQTTGPHMLSDIFSDILQGEPPMRAPTLWESTRFCVDTDRLSTQDRGHGSVARATSELMCGTLEFAQRSGISDIITVIDPVMNRVLKRSDNAPYGYVGNIVQMGKTKALAALLDTTDERINRLRAFAGIEGSVFVDEEALIARMARRAQPAPQKAAIAPDVLAQYCLEQLSAAQSEQDMNAALNLAQAVLGARQHDGTSPPQADIPYGTGYRH
ncbi:acyl-homoserine-lactone synthase [Roseinatronobacter alkalisoli]|uniref:Acyl-homoserine-lactone synthase n=1 Tax=Roseinatronobacter alkalisoli TaxID=3028235 RepID=A0ABT5T5I2_9RHOB|nr:acyl-homoserine-lactone synthase [Roseinatronobacter sp. HJB301]MDD7970357.1 acyl-homoserine-lactone synthase [Roseinatronobacter sp. HJB301]